MVTGAIPLGGDSEGSSSGPSPGLAEQIGRIVGVAVGPVFALGSRARRARLFHPDGLLFEALVHPAAVRGLYAPLAERLKGRALVRASAGWWKNGREWPDLLGMSIRFGGEQLPDIDARDTDQDLLLITARNLKRIPFAFLTTNQHDYLLNHYYAASPFDVEGLGATEFRLVPDPVRFTGSRRYRIERAIHERVAVLRLEARPEGHFGWLPVVNLELLKRSELPEPKVHFYPFNTGRGIAPRGFAHEVRRATYPLSHRLRSGVEHRRHH